MYTRWKLALSPIVILLGFYLIYFINSPLPIYMHTYINSHQKNDCDLSSKHEGISSRSPPSPVSPFVDRMRSFPWIPYSDALRTKNSSGIQRYSNLLLSKLVPFLIKPPTVATNMTCEAPPLEMPTLRECEPLTRPVKVGVLLQFGFNVDALEIHLHELDAVVDKFFLIESIQAHSSYLTNITKPLIWDRVKFDERFTQFSHKVVHFIVDDGSLSQVDPNDVWGTERQQEELRWKKFLEWNNATKYFTTNDIIGFGDDDEIPDRNNVYFLKLCKLPSDPIDIGIWFPFRRIDTVFASDFPIKGHPNTFGGPSFWTLGRALSLFSVSGFVPTKWKGHSLKYLLGGVHLSTFPFPPYQMTKLLTMTSAKKGNTLERTIETGLLYTKNKTVEAQNILNHIPAKLSRRIKRLEAFREENSEEANLIVKVPWFLKCNMDRFPSYNGGVDSRLHE